MPGQYNKLRFSILKVNSTVPLQVSVFSETFKQEACILAFFVAIYKYIPLSNYDQRMLHAKYLCIY